MRRSIVMKAGYAGESGGGAGQVSEIGVRVRLASAVWSRMRAALKGEMSDDTFGSWLAQANVCEGPAGEPVLVTPTGIARDWIRRNAWRRIVELWMEHDPLARPLGLQSRVEFEAGGLARANRIDPPMAPDMMHPVSTPRRQPVFSSGPRFGGITPL